ncbi:GTPase, G3E family [Burkholderia sp. YR290]|jgi:G3E family GTPase|uniref:CobW family GTP-binding protein n=1 Tax=Paraburkholderia hospita TaxID=169430 RepID=UPI0009A678D1|nr:GTP-binding protein [Paraburkholderia hospita]SKC70014.1 GTPase, G3E family [Paraburkholderia hospita]SOE67704.1 GTPase, G3E family [Burkholderia sp. YR290]
MQAGPQFVIVSGMLGSGKTTLLESLLTSESAPDTAIIVNEAGEINIDGAVLSESARGMTMATLSSGCVCCSLTNDLVTTVQDLFESRRLSGLHPFTRIVLECSGLSRPGPIVSSLQELAELRFTLHLVTTYDCSRPSLLSGDFEDAVAQLAAAGTIVLTKVDLVSSERRNEAFAAVTATNPLAKVVNEFSASIRAREAFLQPGGGPSLAVNEQSRQPGRRQLLHPRVRVFRAKLDENVPWETALDWLENLAGALGERLLRIKAIVPGDTRSNRVLLQSVGTTFSAPRRLNPNSSSPLGAVIIARDCGRQDLEEIPTEHPVTWFDH